MEALSELAVWVVDCQTTGASPAFGEVLEIGWGVAHAADPDVRAAETYWVAPSPGRRVSARVRELTGYDERNAALALPPEEIWRRLRGGMGHRPRVPLAIHFAQFELAFLRDWASRFEPEQDFPFDAVCLHAIAARLHPDLPRQSLRALAGYLGHGLELTRRCGPHVEATAFIWHKLAAELRQQGVQSWDELARWLAAPKPPRTGKKKRRFPLPSARYRSLPDVPGVYRFLRLNGSLLYVGKAMSLKKRVSGHFTAGAASTPRALEMLCQIHDIAITPTPTALEAALLENEEIKACRPLYNLQLTNDGATWFANARLDSVSTTPDLEHARGPLASTFSVRALGAIRAVLEGPEGVAAPRALLARAVEAPERWGPEPEVFAAGFAELLRRHGLAHGPPREVRWALRRVARVLLAQGNTPLAEAEGGDAEGPGSAPGLWDPERVLRHLERAVGHAHQVLARARWLCLLCDSVVEFREPGAATARRLVLGGGRLLSASDAAEPAPGPTATRPLGQRQASFDRSQYDRLRTLTTELKRIQRDGGTVAVRVGRSRWLRGPALESILRWV